MNGDATFSPCRTWRYSLSRTWDSERAAVNIIGLNPSTADERADDPTIRRCIAFARAWGYGGLIMTNLFALRATDPRVLHAAVDPVGPENDGALVRCARAAATVVLAWGAQGGLGARDERVLALVRIAAMDVRYFGLTKGGLPRHPLYLPRETVPVVLAGWRREVSHA